MRRNKTSEKKEYSILALDDDPIMTSTLQAYFERSGFQVDVENDPNQAIERIRENHYDILLLDFLMTPICGDQVVAEIRKFNKELFIILLTGHKSMAPPIRTIRQLDIQGYYEKSDRFDQLELLVESCVKSIKQMKTIRSYQNGLSSIMEFLPQVYHLQSLDHMAEQILEALSSLFSCTGCFLAVLPQENAEDNKVQIFQKGELEEAGRMIEEIRTGSSSEQKEELVLTALLSAETFSPVVLGAVLAQPPLYEERQLFSIFARQTEAALGNNALHGLVRRKNEELTQAYDKLGDSYMGIISAMRLMVDAKDFNTRGHSDRVSEISYRIAKEMGREKEFCDRVRMAGLFHDIGKVGVPDQILLKPAKLTDEEFDVIKRHCSAGAQILSAVPLFQSIVPAVRAHHERLDGTGYPDGMKCDEIPLEARIISVADSLDAMISDRQYRKGFPLSKALDELRRGKGTQFDPDLVDILLGLIEKMGAEQFLEETGSKKNPEPPAK